MCIVSIWTIFGSFQTALFLLAADVGARLGMSVVVGSDAQIPVGIVTGFLGGPSSI